MCEKKKKNNKEQKNLNGKRKIKVAHGTKNERVWEWVQVDWV